MRVYFLWDWSPDYSQATVWEDGLAAALRELMRRGHDVRVVTTSDQPTIVKHPYFDMIVADDVRSDVKAFNPDVILHWADMTRPHAAKLADMGIPMAICFAGGELFGENIDLFDHVFVESKVYLDRLLEKGHSASIAFGTNTELFKLVQQNKAFDVFFPATFAAWKRHELFAKASEGLRALAVGYMYEKHEQECWQVCLDHGVTVLPHVAYNVLPRLYAASRAVVVPSMSSGGSQRTVLEAMAMNIPLIVCDSDKFDYVEGQEVTRVAPNVEDLTNAIDEALVKEVNTRDHILENWSEYTYADALEKGLKALL